MRWGIDKAEKVRVRNRFAFLPKTVKDYKADPMHESIFVRVWLERYGVEERLMYSKIEGRMVWVELDAWALPRD